MKSKGLNPNQNVIVQNVDGKIINRPLRTRKFGRLASLDLRDHDHLLSVPRRLPSIWSKTWGAIKPLDQGNSPECVAFSSTQWLFAGPIKNRRAERADMAWTHDLYHRCQENDEWAGEDYEGTSVRASMKVLQGDGYIGEYVWAFEIEPIINHILIAGPIVFGTIWFDGMMDTDKSGFIYATGAAVGGHAYVGLGVNRRKRCPDGSRGAFRILNSWGAWGEGNSGRAWISFVDFAKLLHEDGEAAAAVEIFKQP